MRRLSRSVLLTAAKAVSLLMIVCIPMSCTNAPADSQVSGTPSAAAGSSQAAVTPPSRPGAAVGLAMPAAEAFVGYYVQLLNHAYATGDVDPLLAASDEGCLGCAGTADYLKTTNGSNGGLSGDYVDHLVAVDGLFTGSSGRVGGTVRIRTGDYTERTAPTAAPVRRRSSTQTWRFTLSAANGNWVMYEVEVEE
ncbi:hypothetical protein FB561_2637 [Kribbella amoyensis]|uniref:DUF6318 domain-containing protein n=1 Tax=Kribbella amoyensis TaxID=996641 RepID=A0A561BRM0_9ACTN|nr:hypothetical protein FB561_2637 [Kribbella amoyensis]